MAYQIKVQWNGLKGFAECSCEHGNFCSEGRTQAEALSRVCEKMAKIPELVGARFSAPDCGAKGVIGESTKKRRNTRISDMATLVLVGGMMREGSPK